mmetsp:Transcript_10153/g.21385  ORF Transcript_10153/g.21385 Transcript_10153/m.21385 type:complete len:200 (+) Transcript_10153:997-1596(+)
MRLLSFGFGTVHSNTTEVIPRIHPTMEMTVPRHRSASGGRRRTVRRRIEHTQNFPLNRTQPQILPYGISGKAKRFELLRAIVRRYQHDGQPRRLVQTGGIRVEETRRIESGEAKGEPQFVRQQSRLTSHEGEDEVEVGRVKLRQRVGRLDDGHETRPHHEYGEEVVAAGGPDRRDEHFRSVLSYSRWDGVDAFDSGSEE